MLIFMVKQLKNIEKNCWRREKY